MKEACVRTREKKKRGGTAKAEHTAFLFFRNTVFHAHLKALLLCAKDITYLLSQCHGVKRLCVGDRCCE